MATCPSCHRHYGDDVTSCTVDGATLLPDAAFSNADTELREGDVVGEYRVEAKLGVGGFGTVYRAEHPVIGKKVAIKVLAREFSSKPEVAARFIDEARSANQIRHKGIIDIFAFGALPDGRHYFVMELLEGASLEDHLRASGPLRPEEALPILRGVARAVDAAHAAGIAHRDLKPDNVFLVRSEDGVATKLLDFGVAKLMGNRSGQKTQTGTPIGTPHYMSPEQARGVNVGTKTDVYSFGVMAYQMLTGVLPFDGEAVMDILLKQVTEPPRAPSEMRPELPVALDAPILHMLEKDAEKRPKTLGAAVDELAAAWTSAGGAPEVSATSIDVRPASAARAVSQRTFVGATTEIAPSPRKGRGWIFVAATAVVLAAAGGVAWLEMHRPAKPILAEQHVVEAPSAMPIPSASAPPREEWVEIRVEATPANAEVWDGATELGSAPGPFRLHKSTGLKKLTLRAPGHASRDVDVDTSANAVVSVTLASAPTAAPTPTAAKTTKKPGLPTELEQAY
ncbi:MAG TPA: serine/threonine-protein kinase [Polyangiaceae bacterium]